MRKEDPKKQGFKETVKEFKEELLRIDRVTRVTAWGRQLRFRASVVIWDGKWAVGLWLGKAWEVVVAIEKAVRDAKKNLVRFKIVDWTIAHNVTADFKSAKIMLHPASEGTWIIAWGAARKVISVSWVKYILAKRYGCTNPITNARATIKALSLLKVVETRSTKTPAEAVETPVEAPKAVETPAEVTEKNEAAPKKAPAKKPAPKKTK